MLAGGVAVGALVVPRSVMSGLHWLASGGAAALLSIALWRGYGPKSSAGWLYLALLSLILSTVFYGADAGLELIKPPGSRRHDEASTVGGLELYQLLCPGLTTVALAGWIRDRVARRSRR